MLRRLADVEQQLLEMTCTEVQDAHDLSWTFTTDVADWNISILLERAVQRRGDTLVVPLVCQARKGLGLQGHQGDTATHTVELHCR